MKITNIRFRLPEKQPTNIKAVVSADIENIFTVKGIKVINGHTGLYVAMPRITYDNGKFVNILMPINDEIREQFSDEILNAYFDWIESIKEIIKDAE